MSTSESPEDWGEVVDASQASYPVIFHFQPERFVKIAPNRLQEWEQYVMENTGLLPDRQQAAQAKHGGAAGNLSESLSGSYRGWDDADYI